MLINQLNFTIGHVSTVIQITLLFSSLCKLFEINEKFINLVYFLKCFVIVLASDKGLTKLFNRRMKDDIEIYRHGINNAHFKDIFAKMANPSLDRFKRFD
ncbi:hypothetical protein V1477_018854 [Vespula maculifrons]|uniref:Uncharacterized protein n=1 Tax=Vespula maculifrons TaxID=7453 RepID=A0ABD2AWL4_VESMC